MMVPNPNRSILSTRKRKAKNNDTDFPIVIVGTGFSGVCMGKMLKDAGIESFTILEKADDVGGTWRENTYPGAACDVPSHMYSFSFAPNPNWTRSFSPQEEIKQYIRDCVEKFGLRGHIRFGHKVTGGRFDEETGLWTVEIEDREPMLARVLILGNGALHIPEYPNIRGRDRFKGASWHSAKWNHDVSLKGKKVAVIGTGASAIQFVPEIAKEVAELHLFQRTPPWIFPKLDVAYPEAFKWVFRNVPGTRWFHRAMIYWLMEMQAYGLVYNPALMMRYQEAAKRHLYMMVKDPELREKLTPDYTIGCKRILMANTYYPALTRDNVNVITDRIAEITGSGVRAEDGTEYDVDVIIYGTGFKVSDYLAPFKLVGRNGEKLNERARDKPHTYYGITAHGFPNTFLLMGPNTGLGHNSMIFMIEAQARYTLQAIRVMREKDLAWIDVTQQAQDGFVERVQQKLAGSVWNTGGCSSWYLKDGYNATTWPGFTWEYWLQTRKFDLGAYEAVKRSEKRRNLEVPVAAR